MRGKNNSLTTEERLAVLETQMVTVTRSQREIHDDVKRILEQVNRWRGMGAMFLMVSGAFGVLAGALAKARGWV